MLLNLPKKMADLVGRAEALAGPLIAAMVSAMMSEPLRHNLLGADRKGEVDTLQGRAGPDAYVFHD